VYYHIIVELKGTTTVLIRVDLTETQVLEEYVGPFLARQQILCGGRGIEFTDIERLQITKSQLPNARLVAIILIEWDAAGKKPIAMPPVNVVAAARATDVTDALFSRFRSHALQLEREVRKEVSTMVQDPRSVMVVHGRDAKARTAMFAFLRAIDLRPIEWSTAVQATGSASPYIGQVLDSAFSLATAVVVIFTPDEDARLRDALHSGNDPTYEKELTGQARPNVIFEAGMAFGRHPERTVLVEMGKLRPFSDIAGRHALRINNSAERRNELASRLRTAGCAVNVEGADWLSAGDFDVLTER
jgi:predicted nucleotide-binding protein